MKSLLSNHNPDDNLYVDGFKLNVLCRSEDLSLIIDFKYMAGGFLKEEDFINEVQYPMRLCFCNRCLVYN